MNKYLFFFIVVLFALFGFQDNNKRLGEVQREQGLYIYYYSLPVDSYTILGSVKKTGLVWTGQSHEMLNILIRRAKSDFPEVQALIFTDKDMAYADAIKF